MGVLRFFKFFWLKKGKISRFRRIVFFMLFLKVDSICINFYNFEGILFSLGLLFISMVVILRGNKIFSF